MADLNKIVDELSTLSVIEAAELSKLLEEKWGVTAAAPVAAVAAPASGEAAAEEKDEFSIVLASSGEKSIGKSILLEVMYILTIPLLVGPICKSVISLDSLLIPFFKFFPFTIVNKL